MEGAGSRLGRASSRYGTPTVFSGPVRKWKKKWVQVSSPGLAKSNSHSHSTANNGNGGSRLLLCRWTPVTSSEVDSDKSSDAIADEPPRRKFRYTPIAALEDHKTANFKMEDEPELNETNPHLDRPTSMGKSKYNGSGTLRKEAQEDINISRFDLGMGLKHDLERNEDGDRD